MERISYATALQQIAALLDRTSASTDKLPSERVSERQYLNERADLCHALAALVERAEKTAFSSNPYDHIELVSLFADGFTSPEAP